MHYGSYSELSFAFPRVVPSSSVAFQGLDPVKALRALRDDPLLGVGALGLVTTDVEEGLNL